MRVHTLAAEPQYSVVVSRQEAVDLRHFLLNAKLEEGRAKPNTQPHSVADFINLLGSEMER